MPLGKSLELVPQEGHQTDDVLLGVVPFGRVDEHRKGLLLMLHLAATPHCWPCTGYPTLKSAAGGSKRTKNRTPAVGPPKPDCAPRSEQRIHVSVTDAHNGTQIGDGISTNPGRVS